MSTWQQTKAKTKTNKNNNASQSITPPVNTGREMIYCTQVKGKKV
jgi:hypothetical protein